LVKKDSYGVLPYTSVSDKVLGRFQIVRVVRTSDQDGSAPAGVYKLEVVVSWTEADSTTRTFDLVSYKAI